MVQSGDFINVQTKSLLKPERNASANVKSRLRMVTLYFFDQCKGKYLIAGTGNRKELAIGYFAKYKYLN